MAEDYTPQIDPDGDFAYDVQETLRVLGMHVGEVNVRNGWDISRSMEGAASRDFDPRHVTAHKIAELGLITTEVAEAIEEVRHGHAMNETYYKGEVSGNEYSTPRTIGFPEKPEGVPSELADVIIRVLDLADAYGINIGAALIEKLNHNATRGLHHGGKAL